MSISMNNIESRVTNLEKTGSAIIAQSKNGDNWYIKFNNGLIIQAGRVQMTGSTNQSITVNLLTSFTTTGFVTSSQPNFALEVEGGGWGVVNVVSRTVKSITLKKALSDNINVCWLAIGY